MIEGITHITPPKITVVIKITGIHKFKFLFMVRSYESH